MVPAGQVRAVGAPERACGFCHLCTLVQCDKSWHELVPACFLSYDEIWFSGVSLSLTWTSVYRERCVWGWGRDAVSLVLGLVSEDAVPSCRPAEPEFWDSFHVGPLGQFFSSCPKSRLSFQSYGFWYFLRKLPYLFFSDMAWVFLALRS